jgi:hypothetical protein
MSLSQSSSPSIRIPEGLRDCLHHSPGNKSMSGQPEGGVFFPSPVPDEPPGQRGARGMPLSLPSHWNHILSPSSSSTPITSWSSASLSREAGEREASERLAAAEVILKPLILGPFFSMPLLLNLFPRGEILLPSPSRMTLSSLVRSGTRGSQRSCSTVRGAQRYTCNLDVSGDNKA